MMSMWRVPDGCTSARYDAGSPPGIAALAFIDIIGNEAERSTYRVRGWGCASLQHLDQVVVVVGPQAPARLGPDRLPVLGDLRLREQFGVVGEQHPVAARGDRGGSVVADLDRPQS